MNIQCTSLLFSLSSLLGARLPVSLSVFLPLSRVAAREMMFGIQFTRINSTIDCSIRRAEAEGRERAGGGGVGRWANENVSEVYFNASRFQSEARKIADGKYLCKM